MPTTTHDYATLITKAGTAALPGVEQSQHNLTTAREQAAQERADYEGAQDRHDEMHAAARSLDDTYTPADFAAITGELTMRASRIDGADARVKRAQAALRYADTALADAVADAFRTAIPDTTALATFVSDVADVPRIDELPLALVVQHEPATRKPNGSLSGKVTVKWFKTPHHRTFNTSVLREYTDMRATFGSISPNRHDTCDTFTIDVQAIAPRLPVIRQVSPVNSRAVGDSLATAIARDSLYSNEAIGFIDTGKGVYTTKHLDVVNNAHCIVSEKIDGTARTLTVDASIVYRQHMTLTGHTMHAVAENAVAALVGKFLPGLGRVESADLVTQESSLWLDGDNRALAKAVHVKRDIPTNAAETGYNLAHQLVIRAAIQSDTGM